MKSVNKKKSTAKTKKKRSTRRKVFKKTARKDAKITQENPSGESTQFDTFVPSKEQQLFCDAYYSEDTKGSVADAARKVGIDRTTPYVWMKDAGFEAWFREESRRYMLALEGLKIEAYRQGLEKGNPFTLRLYEERIGNIETQGTGKTEVIFEVVDEAQEAEPDRTIPRA